VAISRHQATMSPPIIESQVIGGSQEQKVAPPREIGYILKNANKAALTAQQKASITKLRQEYESKSKPMKADLEKASSDFQSFMKKTGKRASIKEIQTQTAQVSDLSRQLSTLRKAYWQKGISQLDKKQQKTLSN